MRDMARFSLKQLLVATTLVAVGVGVLALTFSRSLTTTSFAGALIGAGVLTPFRHPWVGAIVGLLFAPLLAGVYYFGREYGFWPFF